MHTYKITVKTRETYMIQAQSPAQARLLLWKNIPVRPTLPESVLPYTQEQKVTRIQKLKS